MSECTQEERDLAARQLVPLLTENEDVPEEWVAEYVARYREQPRRYQRENIAIDLQMALNRARKDTERLDWLEANEAHVVSHRERLGEGWGIWWCVVKRGRSLSGHPLGSPRAAIDAAMTRNAPKEGTDNA